MPTFTTSFSPPAAPENLLATADIDLSRIRLEWDATALGADFSAYRVYRSVGDSSSYEEMALIEEESTNSFDDYEAPINVALFYRVTVANIDGFESDPAEVTSELNEAGWFIVTPNQPAYTFRLRYTQGFRERETLQRERMGALGRRYPIIVSGELEAAIGSMEIEVHPPDAWIIPRIRELAVLDVPYTLLKTPFGEVYRVKIDPGERSRAGVAGIQLFSLGFDEVA